MGKKRRLKPAQYKLLERLSEVFRHTKNGSSPLVILQVVQGKLQVRVAANQGIIDDYPIEQEVFEYDYH